MGLAIARGIVEAHGGRIWIEGGRAGRGTAVRFELPVAREEPLAAAPQAASIEGDR
jgi:two-component system sensor histidine kinase KdpD